MTTVQKYIRSTPLRKRLGAISRATLNRWQKREVNPFPRPAINGNGFQNMWLISDIEEWENAQNSPTMDSSLENHAA